MKKLINKALTGIMVAAEIVFAVWITAAAIYLMIKPLVG